MRYDRIFILGQSCHPKLRSLVSVVLPAEGVMKIQGFVLLLLEERWLPHIHYLRLESLPNEVIPRGSGRRRGEPHPGLRLAKLV
jgi:hypothetical protein